MLAALVLLAAGCATTSPIAAGFTPSGSAVELPFSGQLAATSVAEFGGMLIGVRGRPVVVNVWASWCGPCRVEAPLLQRASTRYLERVTFLGVNSSDALLPARHFMAEFGLTYPNVFDDSGDIARSLGLRGYPTTYVFDRDGKLQASVVGGISEARLAALLQDVLKK